MNKKRKIILIIWFIFILIILLILLFLLGLSLPKLFKSIQDKNKVETQFQYQTQYIYDTNKIQNIINLMNSLKRLKELKLLKESKSNQELYNSIVKSPQSEINYIPDETKKNYDELIKGIAVTTLATGAVIIAAVAFPPIFASLGSSLGQIAAPMALLL